MKYIVNLNVILDMNKGELLPSQFIDILGADFNVDRESVIVTEWDD